MTRWPRWECEAKNFRNFWPRVVVSVRSDCQDSDAVQFEVHAMAGLARGVIPGMPHPRHPAMEPATAAVLLLLSRKLLSDHYQRSQQ